MDLLPLNQGALFGDGTPLASYTVRLGEKSYTAVPLPNQDTKQEVYFLKLSDLTASSTIDAVSYGRADNPKIAQTVIVLGGSDGTGVFKATLSKLRFTKQDATSSNEQLLTGLTTLPRIPEQNLGALVINLDGQVVGMVVSDPSDTTKYMIYPIGRIVDQVVNLPVKSSAQLEGKGFLGG